MMSQNLARNAHSSKLNSARGRSNKNSSRFPPPRPHPNPRVSTPTKICFNQEMLKMDEHLKEAEACKLQFEQRRQEIELLETVVGDLESTLYLLEITGTVNEGASGDADTAQEQIQHLKQLNESRNQANEKLKTANEKLKTERSLLLKEIEQQKEVIRGLEKKIIHFEGLKQIIAERDQPHMNISSLNNKLEKAYALADEIEGQRDESNKMRRQAEEAALEAEIEAIFLESLHERDKSNKVRRKVRKWTSDEKAALEEGVKIFGSGNWKEILSCQKDILKERTTVDLKDKWRNIVKKERRMKDQYTVG